MKSRKITYAAVCAALGVVAVLVSSYTPAKIVPLLFYSASAYISLIYVKWWGLLSVAVSLSLSFLTAGGFTGSFFLALTVFTPYALFALLMRKIGYASPVRCVIRGAAAVAFFIAVSLLLVLSSGLIVGTTFASVIERGGSWVLFLLMGIIAVPTDFFFTFAVEKALALVKTRTGG